LVQLTPELLEKAGVSWKIYQDIGEGLDAAGFWGWTGDKPYIGNYGDNSLLYFSSISKRPGQQSSGTKSENRDQYPEERNAIRHLSAGRSGE